MYIASIGIDLGKTTFHPVHGRAEQGSAAARIGLHHQPGPPWVSCHGFAAGHRYHTFATHNPVTGFWTKQFPPR